MCHTADQGVAIATVDVDRARRETPGCATVTHLNNAGAALPPAVVTDTVIAHLQRESRIGGYEAAAEAAERVEDVYRSLARLIGADPDEIAVVENATRAWDMAFYGFGFRPGDRILTTRAEYASNVIALLQVARRTGAVVELVDDDEHGQIDVSDLGRRLDETVKLVALTHVPSSGGLVNPAAEVGKLTRAAGVPFLLDACQSVGQIPIDVREIGCDLLSATGRKFLRAPRGTGFLYARRELAQRLEPPLLDLHAASWPAPDRYEIRPDARRFETWETNYATKLGLGAAADYALSWDVEATTGRIAMLGEALRQRLRDLPGVSVHDRGARLGGIVTFTVAGVDAAEVKRTLGAAGINTSTSSADYAQWHLKGRGLDDVVRASVHYYNTEEELDRLCRHLPR
ncbi:aminotransferase class V-fold PLP-dependent enzyme [Couchioplanes caeruleus]|uniref:Aminotransferase class V n=2 Tax=Couchioplanes caeruleus TaxID=56438 RepID=A0A1K0G6T6_9ACTN|nr:aminotransferase class V-fold PLP-dependent enzyme [Couchioplanes caeruleus]OJF12970.1 aminotransferase class V [Couchioplanes caeruleus subsp. caeruleus]ROP31996.1 selenocysteine lyase/cysteine desulfurase [Couchioplanes caeruleus]